MPTSKQLLKRIQKNEILAMESRFRANFINSISGFKSVGLIGSISKENKTNLAIFSQVFHLGANPALMGFIVRPDISPRHTLENIEAQKYFTFNHIKEEFFKKAHQTAARYSKEVSEFEATGLTPHFENDFVAPYVKESEFRIGLKLEERHDLSINNTIFLIASVQEVILNEEIIEKDGYLDIEKAGTITTSCLDSYHTTTRLERLPYAKP
ncbi:flavin reductase family protein [Bernardetia sp.]|uniref:flavin reductase family protein n=1 Tax=Bernardetia sp. TaxID=1937974 RepID=UPI0025BC3ECE|nr:flavin reductase [Bernardetia sp.]